METDLGHVEKNILVSPVDKAQLQSVEHKLDNHFRESDPYLSYKADPNHEGYQRQFGSLE